MRLINSKNYSILIRKSQQTINSDVFKRRIDYIDISGTIRFLKDEDLFLDREVLTRKEVLNVLSISLTTAKNKKIFEDIESIDVNKKRFLKKEVFKFIEKRKVNRIEYMKKEDNSFEIEINRLAKERRKKIEKELRRRESLKSKAS